MAATFLSARALAQRLIQKNGRTVTYSVKSTTLVDVNNPQLGVVGTTDLTPKAVFITEALTERTKNLVQAGDKICLIAADDLPGVTPGTSDFVVDKLVNYDVESVEPTDPGDAPIVYEFLLRS